MRSIVNIDAHARVRSLFALSAAFALFAAAPDIAGAEQNGVLRVCADPNNLPFSNARGEGFENRIAEIVARDLGATVEYTWWAQRRGFLRNTLYARSCDVVIGISTGHEMVLTTRPYYRSRYVVVSRRDRALDVRSFDDPRLARLRIGVQVIGDDYANAPPAHALAHRGIVDNVVGFTVYGNYAEPNPPAAIVDAVRAGAIDLAVVWGPLAGYFARSSAREIAIRPLAARVDRSGVPMSFDIAMGVRPGEMAWRNTLDRAIGRNHRAIRRVLRDYGVPLEGG